MTEVLAGYDSGLSAVEQLAQHITDGVLRVSFAEACLLPVAEEPDVQLRRGW